jgi:hypothetical protein
MSVSLSLTLILSQRALALPPHPWWNRVESSQANPHEKEDCNAGESADIQRQEVVLRRSAGAPFGSAPASQAGRPERDAAGVRQQIGRFDVLAYEFESQSLAAYEQAWAAFDAHPTVASRLQEWMRRWDDVTDTGGMNEIWRLVE